MSMKLFYFDYLRLNLNMLIRFKVFKQCLQQRGQNIWKCINITYSNVKSGLSYILDSYKWQSADSNNPLSVPLQQPTGIRLWRNHWRNKCTRWKFTTSRQRDWKEHSTEYVVTLASPVATANRISSEKRKSRQLQSNRKYLFMQTQGQIR